MACVPLPAAPSPPSLPDGISLTPTIPIPNFDPALCCKIVQLPTPPALPPLPPGVFNPAVAAAVEALLASVLAYLDGLPVNCPKE